MGVAPSALSQRPARVDRPAEDLLAAERLAADGLFDPQAVGQLWARHLAGEQWQYPLWTIVQFQAWKRRWLP